VKKPTAFGKNKTGTDMAPVQASETVQGAVDGGPSPAGSFPGVHAEVYKQYNDGGLEPIGTMPPPATPKGVAKVAMSLLKGQKGNVLLDKIGERLAFERTGTRLYDLLLIKHDLHGSWAGGPTREQLLEIRNEEQGHFRLLSDTLEDLGADATAMTPCADVTAMESLGLHNVIADPRTTLAQSLHAALIAELADNAGWEMLIELADSLGQTELAGRFRIAEENEARHLARVRAWVRADTELEAGARSRPSASAPAK